jgi:hypothetical protein
MLAKRRRTPTLAASRRRSADAELWRPLRARRSKGTRDEVGKLRLLRPTNFRSYRALTSWPSRIGKPAR